MKKGQIHRHFNREFKLGAVQLVTEKGMPVGTVALPIFFIHGGEDI
jgi:transposase-like protein